MCLLHGQARGCAGIVDGLPICVRYSVQNISYSSIVIFGGTVIGRKRLAFRLPVLRKCNSNLLEQITSLVSFAYGTLYF